MRNSGGTERDDARLDAERSEVGDVEQAGETTAADTVTGPTDTRPVGADTMLKVADEAKDAGGYE